MKNPPSITQLQEHWHRLSDLERARAVQAIISRSGLSIRKIAAQLRLSESLLRHLLQALRAPDCDRLLPGRARSAPMNSFADVTPVFFNRIEQKFGARTGI